MTINSKTKKALYYDVYEKHMSKNTFSKLINEFLPKETKGKRLLMPKYVKMVYEELGWPEEN